MIGLLNLKFSLNGFDFRGKVKQSEFLVVKKIQNHIGSFATEIREIQRSKLGI